jgi:protocatechuate 3,4-dioxygenase beta subunit
VAAVCQDTLVEQTEGPYYTPGAPERTDLTDDATIGIPLALTGRVLDASCAPVAGALIEFWQADGAGVYDNSGYGLRGTQVTDGNGAYTLGTVIPGLYPSRTEHIHVKVTGPDGVVRTTQLYFPDVPQNDSDGIYSDTMLVTVTEQTEDRMAGTFDFVLP